MFFNRVKVPSLSMAKAHDELENKKNIVLIDVRTPGEYASGHIPGSINLPPERLSRISEFAPDKDTRIFMYCLSGARSAHAATMLVKQGYTDVTNIGGISQWPGKIEKGN